MRREYEPSPVVKTYASTAETAMAPPILVTQAPPPASGVKTYASVFKTRLGWCGIIYNEKKGVERIYLPTSKSKALEYVKGLARKKITGIEARISAYFKGGEVDFSGVECALDRCPPFHKKVYEKLLKVPYGKTVTYAELARMAGAPKAPRAVGSAMAKNPLPLIIPCHRVIKSNGEIGNFSSDRGPALKRMMINMERS